MFRCTRYRLRRHLTATLAAPAVLVGVLAGLLPAVLPAGVRASEGPGVTVRSLRLQDQAASAQLTLLLSGPVRPHIFRLAHPARLVIDLPHTRRRAALPPIAGSGLVTGLRSGVQGSRHTLRLVLTLGARCPYSWRWDSSPAGARLRLQIGSPVAAGITPRSATPSDPIRAAHAPSGARSVIVAVDPGHGGVDPGASGPDGVHEKDVTLAIARALAARIDAAPGMRAVLTRDGDYFVPLRTRMERARAAHADLFVSIHADSVRDPLVSGASVYILSERGASSEAAKELADQENAADLKGGISLASQAPDLRSVLLNLTQNASMGQSGEAAEDVLRSLDRIGTVRKLEVQHAAFVVLKSPDVPSMLVETAYISNRTDERRLNDPQQQHHLAEALFAGIAAYFRQYPPQGSLFARAHAVASTPSS